MVVCSEAGCDDEVRARSLCARHYQQHVRDGDLDSHASRQDRNAFGCVVDGCGNKVQARQMCAKHYQQDRAARNGAQQCRGGSCTSLAVFDGLCRNHYHRRRRMDEAKELRDARRCSVEGCGRPYDANGYCQMHYRRVRDTGSPGSADRGRAAPGTGHVNNNGYRSFKRANGRHEAEHRLVMEQVLGRPLLPNENVHHLNGIRLDNRPENLELWVKPQAIGQRVADLVRFVVEHYPSEAEEALRRLRE